MKNIFNLTKLELEEYFVSINEKKFKAMQVIEWLYEKRENDITKWSNVKKELQEKIKTDFSFAMPKIIKREIDTLTEKYLIELSDSEQIEAVLMRHDYGNSVCISTQVGCNMGCSFCESGRLKKVRNLETHEMVTQILLIESLFKERISSIVIMGIGEPFDNYDNVISFLKIINEPKGIAIGARHITVSTCGIIPKIKEFMLVSLQVNLAISLHAPNDTLRNQLMIVNKTYNIKQLIDVLNEYITYTNRRVTIEYVMLYNINDRIHHAKELARLLKGMNVYVNLIPYNETNHLEFKKSTQEDIMRFYDVLKTNRLNVTIRREFGSNISAACGQLRSKEVEK